MQRSYNSKVSFVEIKVPVQATSPRCRLTANTLSAKRTEPEKPVSRTQWQSISAMNCMLASPANKFYCKRHRAMSCDWSLWKQCISVTSATIFLEKWLCARHRAMSSESQKQAQRNVKEFLFPSDMQCSYDLEVSFVEISANASDIAAMSSDCQHLVSKRTWTW